MILSSLLTLKGLKYTCVLSEFKHTEIFFFSRRLFANTTPGVGLSIAGLDHAKFGFYRFQRFLFIVVMVISILLKTAF